MQCFQFQDYNSIKLKNWSRSKSAIDSTDEDGNFSSSECFTCVYK